MTNISVLRIIGVVAVVAVSNIVIWWIARATAPMEEGGTVKIEMVQRPMEIGDIPEPSEPTVIKKYKEPDSQDVRTDCIQVPTWLDTLESTSPLTTSTPALDSVEPKPDSGAGGRGSDNTPRTSRNLRTALRGLPYVITPMIQGSPSLSVDAQQVTLSSINPQTGAGMKFEYDVPQPTWALTAEATSSVGRTLALGRAALHVEHRGDWGALGIGPSLMAAVTEDGYTADYGVSIAVRTTLISW